MFLDSSLANDADVLHVSDKLVVVEAVSNHKFVWDEVSDVVAEVFRVC